MQLNKDSLTPSDIAKQEEARSNYTMRNKNLTFLFVALFCFTGQIIRDTTTEIEEKGDLTLLRNTIWSAFIWERPLIVMTVCFNPNHLK